MRLRSSAENRATLYDIVAPGAMSFQLNVSSPANAKCVWQQYCTALDPKWGDSLGIGWSIENFPSKEFRWKLHNDVGLPCNGGTDEATCKGNLYNYPPKKGPFYTAPGGESLAGREACLPHGRGLLVAEHAADRHAADRAGRGNDGELMDAWHDGREHRARHAEDRA